MPKEYAIDVVDDDESMRESLVTLLTDSGYLVRAHASAEDLLALGLDALSQTGCVVTDVRMPGMDGLSLLRTLRANNAMLPVVLMTGHGELPLGIAAMKAGAIDFLEKPFAAEALLHAIEEGLRTRRSSGFESEDPEAARRRLEALTPREDEVLELLVSGDSNKLVAAKLGLSPRTVEFHRAHIMEKTGTRRLAELVRIWLAARPPL